MLGVEEIQTDVSDATGTLHDTVEGDGEWVGSAESMDLRKSESCQNLDIPNEGFALAVQKKEHTSRRSNRQVRSQIIQVTYHDRTSLI